MERKFKVVATDVDGTLTIDRTSFKIYSKVIDAIDQLVKRGFYVVLVSGNSYPLLNGLARYLGVNGPIVAENGCIVAWKDKIVYKCPKTAKHAALLVEKEFKEYLTPSWQNEYRLCDYAYRLKNPNQANEVIKMINKFLEEKGFTDLKVTYSGYAIHILPIGCGKDVGIRKVCEILNVKEEEVVVIGDGINDLELFNIKGLKVTVSNADTEVIEKADIVLENPSGRGFVELVEKLLKIKIQ